MLTGKRHNALYSLALLSLAVGLLASGLARAQDNAANLEELVGPIALYPDDLLAIALPASTYPLQVVQAARFLEERKTNTNLKPDDEWDDAVVALLNYPEIIEQMNNDLDWTWALGEAFINEQTATMDAIQNFRQRAVVAGNLKSDDHQIVHEVDGAIEIEPADPEVIYVPYYEPTRVVVRHYRPVYHYYPHAYPVYYYPYGYGHHFANDLFWGVTTHFAFNWISHGLYSHHYSHYSHPYRGYSYRRPLYTRHHFNRHRVSHNARHNNAWRPASRHGARPRDGVNTRRHAGFARNERRVNNNRRNSVQQPRNRNTARTVVRNQPRTNRNVNRNANNRDQRNNRVQRTENRSSFAPRNAEPRSRTVQRHADRKQSRNQSRTRFAPRNSQPRQVTPQRNDTNATRRVAQNRSSPQVRRNDMADTARNRAPRQQRAAPNKAQRRAAPARRAAASRAAPNRAAPRRAEQNRSAPARAAPRQSRQSPRAAPRSGRQSRSDNRKFAGRSGSRSRR